MNFYEIEWIGLILNEIGKIVINTYTYSNIFILIIGHLFDKCPMKLLFI